MTKEEVLALVDALRERGATSVEVDGVKATFPAPPRLAEQVAPPVEANGEAIEDEDARELRVQREMLWSAD